MSVDKQNKDQLNESDFITYKDLQGDHSLSFEAGSFQSPTPQSIQINQNNNYCATSPFNLKKYRENQNKQVNQNHPHILITNTSADQYGKQGIMIRSTVIPSNIDNSINNSFCVSTAVNNKQQPNLLNNSFSIQNNILDNSISQEQTTPPQIYQQQQQLQQFSNQAVSINSSMIYNNNKTVSPLTSMNEGLAKKLTDLESELMKEKATVQVLTAEKDNLQQKLNYSFVRSSPSKSKEELAKVYSLLKEKDQIIQSLMEEVKQRPERHSVESEKSFFCSQINTLKSSILEFENKTALLATENERLQHIIKDRELENRRIQAEISGISDQHRKQLDQISQEYEQKLSRLLLEQEKLILMNQNLQKKVDNLNQNYTNLEKRHELQSEEIKNQWKQHFEKELADYRERSEVERGLIESQLRHSRQLNVELEQKINQYLKEIENIKKTLIQRDQVINDCESKIQYLEQRSAEYEVLLKLNSESQEKIVDHEGQVASLKSENERMTELLDMQKSEVDSWMQKYEQLAQSNQLQMEELRKQFEIQISNMIETDQNIFSEKLQAKDREAQQLSQNIEFIQQESDKYKEQIYQKMKEIDSIKIESIQIQQKLEVQINNLMEVKLQLNGQVSKLEEERISLQNQNTEIEQSFQDLQFKNDQLNKDLKVRNEELEIWKSKYMGLQVEMEQKMNEISFNHDSQIRLQREQYQTEQNLLQKRINESEKRFQTTLAECQSSQQKQVESWQQRQLIIEQRLRESEQKRVEELASITNESRARQIQVEQQLRAYQEESEAKRHEANSLALELDALKKRQQITEEESIKRKVLLTEQIEKNTKLIAESDLLRHKANECEKLKIELDRQAINFQDEIVNIKELYEQKQRACISIEVNRFQAEITTLEGQLSQTMRQLESIASEKQDLINSHQVQMEQLKQDMEVDFNNHLHNHSQQLRQIITDHQNEINNLNRQKELSNREQQTLRKTNQNLMGEIEMLQERVSQLDTQHPFIRDLQQQIEQLKIENRELRHKLNYNLEKRRVEVEQDLKIRSISQNNRRPQSIDREPVMISKHILRGETPHRHITPTPERMGHHHNINLSILEENDKLNKRILNRCRQIVTGNVSLDYSNLNA